MDNKTIFEALHWASSFLVDNGREETSARILLQHVLQENYSGLMMKMHDNITKEAWEQFQSYVYEHVKGKPVQYITGVEEFYGRTFRVNESVLIPRPETEELIVGAIERMEKIFSENHPISIADIGTGSGIIAITMKLEWPTAEVTATDISPSAIETAKFNANALNAKVNFRLGDLTEPIEDTKWDVILSNPPYISHAEAKEMSDIVLNHEPHNALFADEEGLYFYRKLAENLPKIVKDKALIGVEIGFTQGKQVANLFQKAFPNSIVEIVQDINKKDRIVFCKIDV